MALSEFSLSLLFSGITPGSEELVVISSVGGTVDKLICSGRTTYILFISALYWQQKKTKARKRKLPHTQQSWLGVYRELNGIQIPNLNAGYVIGMRPPLVLNLDVYTKYPYHNRAVRYPPGTTSMPSFFPHNSRIFTQIVTTMRCFTLCVNLKLSVPRGLQH